MGNAPFGRINDNPQTGAPFTPQRGLPYPSPGDNGGVKLAVPSIPPASISTPARSPSQGNLVAQGPGPAAAFAQVFDSNPHPPTYDSVAPAPAINGAALVESYDEETYTCRPNDSFRAISRTYFQDERYAQALFLFNRDHPLATDTIRRGPATLAAGTSIYIPPLRILQKYYGQAIGQAAPVQSQTSGVLQPAALPLTPAPQPRERSYQVRAQGEMLRDIARRTLNDPERWTEIYQLNRRYDPSVPVPAGSELRLPADARVE